MVVAHLFEHVRAQKMHCKEQRPLNLQKCTELWRLNSFLWGVVSSKHVTLQIKEPLSGSFFVSTSGTVQVPV